MHKLSVIINSYNSNQAHLDAAIKSVLVQTGVDVECIVSTVVGDEAIRTAEINGVLVVQNEKPDIYKQINRALDGVSGDWFFSFQVMMLHSRPKRSKKLTSVFETKKKFVTPLSIKQVLILHLKSYSNFTTTLLNNIIE